jgi:hypothetical protein
MTSRLRSTALRLLACAVGTMALGACDMTRPVGLPAPLPVQFSEFGGEPIRVCTAASAQTTGASFSIMSTSAIPGIGGDPEGTEIYGMNNTGWAVGRMMVGTGWRAAVRSPLGGWQEIAGLAAGDGIAYDINDAGQFVGRIGLGASARAFTGTATNGLGVVANAVPLSGLEATVAFARAINESGQIAGYMAFEGGGVTAFRWTSGTIVQMGRPDGRNTFGYGINAQGHVVGAVGETANPELNQNTIGSAFFYYDGTTHVFEASAVGGTQVTARAVNSAGEVAGYAVVDGVTKGFVVKVTAGVLEPVRWVPGSLTTRLFAINETGIAVGYRSNGGDEGILWDSRSGGDPVALAKLAGGCGSITFAVDDCSVAGGFTLSATGGRSIATRWGFCDPPLGRIGDFVWWDQNSNGIQDPGEPGIAGVLVTLSSSSGTLLDSQWTDANGGYLFINLPAGTYVVTAHAPPGFVATLPTQGGDPAKDSNPNPATVTLPTNGSEDLTIDFGFVVPQVSVCPDLNLGSGVSLGTLTDYLFIFTDGRSDANWQSASKGYVGNVAVKGTVAKERSSGSFAYAGTIFTNDGTLDGWQRIVNNNPTQAASSLNQIATLAALETSVKDAMVAINALPVTAGFVSRSVASLNNLDVTGLGPRVVINVTSGFGGISQKINIWGTSTQLIVMRWDTDANPANGYQGQVKFQSGGAIVPQGGLTPANFVHVAGDINASGGGSNPPAPYPQGPRLDNGQGALITGASNFSGGGFFTGYWLTTGKPSIPDTDTGLWYGESSSMSNGIFVGGWYSINTKFSMTSGTSGVHVICPPGT